MTKPMNKIEKLIEELCPQGVEFKALGEVLDLAAKGIRKLHTLQLKAVKELK